jgi:crotonobetainyl-CoA:carnitine CoA-transferase CaiB-like acyl-CoA transferase
MKVLQDIKVFELGNFAVAPVAGSMLGDLGADVIKVEHPTKGDQVRGTTFQWGSQRIIKVNDIDFYLEIDMMNRSKRGITLNCSKERVGRLPTACLSNQTCSLPTYGRKHWIDGASPTTVSRK